MSTTTAEPPPATVPHANPAETPALASELSSFDSLETMRDEHTRLLKLFYSAGATPELVAQAKDFLQRGRVMGSDLDRPDERLEAQRILDQWGTVIMKAVHEEIDATLAEFQGKDLSGQPCPYVGLRPFEEGDCSNFHGRERLQKQALEILRGQRFLAILGPSGSGKSSLVLGGILPLLRTDALPSSGQWTYIPPMVPGAAPLESLVNAFHASPGLLPPDFDSALLRVNPLLLAETIRPATSGQTVLLVIDQFEEIFTLCEDAALREAFIRSLLALVEDAQASHRLILTMRSDFESCLASLPELQARFLENGAVLRAIPLTREELREAIEGPAREVGLHFHREVIDALLKDVGDEMTGLPLLQFTLRKLWDTKRLDRITLQQYNNLGGAKGALAKSADEFYDGLVPEERTIARRILLRMVRLGDGLEVTSARIRRSSLFELGYDQARVDHVIRRLIASGLIRLTRATNASDDQLEVAHEAMVRNWRRFVRWLEDDRASLLIRRRLDDMTAEWLRLGGGTAGLLDKTQLEEAREWVNTAPAKALGFHSSLPLLMEKSDEFINAAEREKEAAKEKLRRAEEEQRERVDAERHLRLLEESKRADLERERASTQAKVARRMRRIARLALVENALIFFAVVAFLLGQAFIGGMLVLIGIGFGMIILVMALRAIMSSQQPDPSSRPRSLLSRSVGSVLAGAQGLIGSDADFEKENNHPG